MYITKLVDSKLSPNHLLVKDGQPSVVTVDVGVSVGVDGDAGEGGERVECDETHVVQYQDSLVEGDSGCLLYTSPSPRDATLSRMPSSA